MTRYDFGAIAEVSDLDSRDDMIVVTRDLGLSGCFVKSRTPFPAGTEVRVKIAYAGSDFAAIGSVTENITREGMEIEFVQIEPKYQAIIEQWLGVSASNYDRERAAGSWGGRVVRLTNRLIRHEQNRRVTSVDSKRQADGRGMVDPESRGSVPNLWKIRNERTD